MTTDTLDDLVTLVADLEQRCIALLDALHQAQQNLPCDLRTMVVADVPTDGSVDVRWQRGPNGVEWSEWVHITDDGGCSPSGRRWLVIGDGCDSIALPTDQCVQVRPHR